ncbi:MAG: class I SAM-dependent methyltransferase [Candidatus Omnitrophica bacterium]|nr:class I SAM-dependent methyltransferase [Candidatus Omnitrophota bacterium]
MSSRPSLADRLWHWCYRCLEQPYLFELSRLPQRRMTQRLIAQELPPTPGRRLLDICCGIGTYRVSKPDTFYIGLDREPSYVAYAAARHNGHPGTTFLVADATALPFRPQTFTDVMWLYSLHHFADDPARAILSSVARMRPRRLLILDAVGDHLRGHKRMLAARDRGAYVRPIAAQRALIERDWVIETSGVETHPVVLDTVYYRCVPKLGD